MSVFQVDTQAGRPVYTGDKKIIPLSQAVKINPPGTSAVLVWNRPVAVIVQKEGGIEHTLPVRDATKLAQVSIFGLALFSTLLILFLRRKPR